MKRIILPVMADSHGGHKKGLLNPDTVLYDEDEDGNKVPYHVAPTASQEYLNELHTQIRNDTVSLAKGDDILFMHLSDICHGKKYPNELVSTRLSDQTLIADYNLRPWGDIPNVKAMRLTTGTDAHEFEEGSATAIVANAMQGRYQSIDIQPINHGLWNIDNFLVDYSHHGPYPGSRYWLRGNVAQLYLKDLMTRHILHHKRPPDLVLRGHYHTYVRVTVEVEGYESTLIVMPAMCMMDSHSLQVTQSKDEITVGMIVFEILDGHLYKIYRYMKLLDIRTKEVYEYGSREDG